MSNPADDQPKHEPMTRPLSVVLLVIGSMALVVWLYSICLFVMCVWHGDTESGAKALEQFKDFGIYAAGALSGFLARTTIGSDQPPAMPASVTVANPPSDPVNTSAVEPSK